MFDKEFEQKLRESMDIPREMEFDEGAWKRLSHKLDVLHGATGPSPLWASGIKITFVEIKAWMLIGTFLTLLGVAGFFFYQWQAAERRMEALQLTQLGNEGNEGNERNERNEGNEVGEEGKQFGDGGFQELKGNRVPAFLAGKYF